MWLTSSTSIVVEITIFEDANKNHVFERATVYVKFKSNVSVSAL